MDVSSFSIDQMCKFLLDEGIPADVASSFSQNCISGAAFVRLLEADLRDLCPLIGIRTKIRDLLEKVRINYGNIRYSSYIFFFCVYYIFACVSIPLIARMFLM